MAATTKPASAKATAVSLCAPNHAVLPCERTMNGSFSPAVGQSFVPVITLAANLRFLLRRSARIPHRSSQHWPRIVGGHIEEPHASCLAYRCCEAKYSSKHEARSAQACLPPLAWKFQTIDWSMNGDYGLVEPFRISRMGYCDYFQTWPGSADQSIAASRQLSEAQRSS